MPSTLDMARNRIKGKSTIEEMSISIRNSHYYRTSQLDRLRHQAHGLGMLQEEETRILK
jgi:hypothetical protein